MDDLSSELVAEHIEEEYLEETNSNSDEVSGFLNDDSDEEQILEEEITEINPESSKLRAALRIWFICNKVSRSGSNNLLSILRNVSSLSAFSSLPQDVRTLLKAPVNVSQQIVAVPGGGQMWYQGVECCLQHYFRNTFVAEEAFELNLSTDGIRSPIQMWPILMQLHNMPSVPVM
uniref:Uncharacterized protein n=1 Tax=Anopheles funestus TaxID=62324 RepID=A0A182RJZ9_ANOFN